MPLLNLLSIILFSLYIVFIIQLLFEYYDSKINSGGKMIMTVTLNPALDKTIEIDEFKIGSKTSGKRVMMDIFISFLSFPRRRESICSAPSFRAHREKSHGISFPPHILHFPLSSRRISRWSGTVRATSAQNRTEWLNSAK